MTLAVAAVDMAGRTADDGLLSFNCPRCGKVVLRYHPSLKGQTELQCPRTGVINKERGHCHWKDMVYFNTIPKEML